MVVSDLSLARTLDNPERPDKVGDCVPWRISLQCEEPSVLSPNYISLVIKYSIAFPVKLIC